MPFAGAMNQRMQSLAGLGRGGDTTLAHLTPGEVVVPRSIAEMYPDLVSSIADAIRRRGRNPSDFIVGAPEGPLNPHTGMEEFGLGGDGVGGGEAGDSPGGSGGGSTGGDSTGGQTDPADSSIGVGLGDTFGHDAFGGGAIGGANIGADVETQGTPSNPGIGPFGGGFESGLTVGPATTAPTDLIGPSSGTSVTPDREGQAGGPGAPTGRGQDVSPESIGLSRGDFGLGPSSSFSRSSPSQSGISGLGGPRGATPSDPGAAVAGRQGFFGAMQEAATNPSNPNLAKGLSLAGMLPGIGMLGTIGRGVQFASDTFDNLGKPSYDNPLGGTPGVENQAVAAGATGFGPQGGPLGDQGGTSEGGGIVARAPAFNQGALQAGAATPIPAPAAQLTPQEAAQVADQLGISNDPLQARAQIATYALNASGADFRTPEAAALWETLLAQSYSPSPGLLDIERQYMAEVLGYGAQAYEGEDEAARALAQTGAPIRRAETPV